MQEKILAKIRAEMAAFDTLPVPVRAALREASYNWPARELIACCGDARLVAQVVDLVQRSDAELLERRKRIFITKPE